MSYKIQRGDCLSVLAQRFHTTVGDLMKANPQIKDKNLIYAGANLNIPGSKDSFHPAGGSGAARGSSGTGGTSPVSGHGHGTSAYSVAQSLLGRNIQDLKYNGSIAKYLDKWPSSHVCCANFVSAALQKAGLISKGEHNDSVRGLANNLRNDPNWHSVSLKNAKPGDVVCFHVPGEGDFAHVEMFAGWKNGKPQFIGSNNINPDGSQRISQGYAGYAINAIFEHN